MPKFARISKTSMMQAMIFAAGLGTRLRPITDHMPKAMVSVGGKPLIRHVIEKLVKAGTERIVVNVHHFAGQITDYLHDNDNFNTDIRISDETEKLLDTGGGIKKAMPMFRPDSPVLIHNVDILSNVDLRKFYDAALGNGTVGSRPDAVLLVSERKTKRYLLFNDRMELAGWTNVETGEVKSPYGNINPKDYAMYAFAGIHVLSPRLSGMMDSEFPDKFGIVDFYLKACATHTVKGYLKKDLRLLDVGKADSLQEAGDFLHEIEREPEEENNQP